MRDLTEEELDTLANRLDGAAEVLFGGDSIFIIRFAVHMARRCLAADRVLREIRLIQKDKPVGVYRLETYNAYRALLPEGE